MKRGCQLKIPFPVFNMSLHCFVYPHPPKKETALPDHRRAEVPFIMF
jgi:hypothetical protein